MSIDATVYRGQGETETEIDVEVTGDLEPYFPGSMDEPPSGGGIEDLSASVTNGGRAYSILLTEDEERDFAAQLAESAMDDEPDFDEPDDIPDHWSDDRDD